ncbi:MAG: nickel ABC transporter permease subunit NikB [Spirochaetaceae bacterium]|jgi:nickel transport system permease protein|nr:nickel ABC transporter permease subunit NikB [Spirochaetaceae bacterium]
MAKFIVKRILMLIPMLFIVSVIVFLLLHAGPNDPAMSYLRLSNIPPTDAALENARHELGLDRPLLTQYISWISRAVRMDFGISYVTKAPVTRHLLHYLPNTLYLAGVSIVIMIVLSLPMGMLAAKYHGKWQDNVLRVFAYAGVSIPSFWFAFLMIFIFAIRLKWLPALGMGGLRYVIMPSLSVVLMSTCINARLLRGNMLEQANTRYVVYARFRGVREKYITRHHIMKNSFIPVVTAMGMHIGEVLGGAVVAEVIFAWPGVGRYAVSAINNRDFPVMQCFILMMTVIFVLCNLVTDILYAALDPRIRYGEGGISHA